MALTVQTMDRRSTASLPNTLDEAECPLDEVGLHPGEVVADKGYHSNTTFIPRLDAGLGGGYHKSRQGWSVDLALDRSRYWPNLDEIEFGETYYNKFTAAHEYGHAVHEYELGGLWGTEAAGLTLEIGKESGYRCAFQEGMANYAGEGRLARHTCSRSFVPAKSGLAVNSWIVTTCRTSYSAWRIGW